MAYQLVKKYPEFFFNLHVQYHSQKSQPPVSTLSQVNSIRTLLAYFL
jgi:hypothetical protein